MLQWGEKKIFGWEVAPSTSGTYSQWMDSSLILHPLLSLQNLTTANNSVELKATVFT